MNDLKIIMNPPYDKSLHLKILDKMIKDFPEAEIVNLSPAGWLQDPLAKDKKSNFNKFVELRKHIEDLEVIPQEDGKNMFRAQMHQDLGLYKLSKNGGFDTESLFKKYSSFIDKIKKYQLHWSDKVEHQKIDGIRVKTQMLRPFSWGAVATALGKVGKSSIYDKFTIMYEHSPNIFINGEYNGIWWTETLGAKNQYSKNIGDPLVDSIKFDTVEEAQNFEAFAKTKFMVFCNKVSKVGVNTDFKFLPFMPTYKHPWTDQDLYEYFKLTPEEIDTVEKEMNEVLDI